MAPTFRKYSDAIRHGARLRPKQARGMAFDGQGTDANGAAAEALGVVPHRQFGIDARHAIVAAFPEVVPVRLLCPYEECRTFYSAEVLAEHLNDTHRWTREAIADFMEADGL